jgi:hypothetical protein
MVTSRSPPLSHLYVCVCSIVVSIKECALAKENPFCAFFLSDTFDCCFLDEIDVDRTGDDRMLFSGKKIKSRSSLEEKE